MAPVIFNSLLLYKVCVNCTFNRTWVLGWSVWTVHSTLDTFHWLKIKIHRRTSHYETDFTDPTVLFWFNLVTPITQDVVFTTWTLRRPYQSISIDSTSSFIPKLRTSYLIPISIYRCSKVVRSLILSDVKIVTKIQCYVTLPKGLTFPIFTSTGT